MQLGSPSPPLTPLSPQAGYQMGSQTGTPHWDGGCSQKDLKIQAQVNLSHNHRLANLVFVLSSPHSQVCVPSVLFFQVAEGKAFALTRSGISEEAEAKLTAQSWSPGLPLRSCKQEVEGTCFRNTPGFLCRFPLQPFCPFRATKEKMIRKPVGSPLNHAGQFDDSKDAGQRFAPGEGAGGGGQGYKLLGCVLWLL